MNDYVLANGELMADAIEENIQTNEQRDVVLEKQKKESRSFRKTREEAVVLEIQERRMPLL